MHHLVDISHLASLYPILLSIQVLMPIGLLFTLFSGFAFLFRLYAARDVLHHVGQPLLFSFSFLESLGFFLIVLVGQDLTLVATGRLLIRALFLRATTRWIG